MVPARGCGSLEREGIGVKVKVSNKELRSITDDAVKRGWSLAMGGGTHFHLTNGGHRVVIASSPSDTNGFKNVLRRIANCEAGMCEHGGEGAVVSDASKMREARMQRAAARADREQAEAAARIRMQQREELKENMQTIVEKPKRKTVKRGPSKQRVAAERWARWYVGDRPGASKAQPEVLAASKQAGHSGPQARAALIAAGAVPVDHGRNGATWEFPSADHTSTESTPVVDFPASQQGLAMVHASGGSDAGECDTEWARLEGMVAVLGHPALIRQVDRVRRLVQSAEHE